MAIIPLKCVKAILILCLSHSALSLYEDQVGKFDWKQSFVGKVKYAKFEGKRVIVATEENVLAALNSKNGNILRRRTLEDHDGYQIEFLHLEKDVVTVSGNLNNLFVRGWDVTTGVLLWEWSINSDKSLNSYWLVHRGYLYQVIAKYTSHLEVVKYQLNSGQTVGESYTIPAPWTSESSKCVLSQNYFTCLSSDDAYGFLYYVDVVSEQKTILNVPLASIVGDFPGQVDLLEFESREPSVLILVNTVAKLVYLRQQAELYPYSLQRNAVSIPVGGEEQIFELEINAENPQKLLRVKSKTVGKKDEVYVDVEYPLGLGAPYTVAGQCRETGCDLLLSSTDNALCLVKLPEGKVSWTREESLSQITAVEFLELPVSELDVSIEDEFISGDVLSMLVHRLTTQAKQFYQLLFGHKLFTSSTGLVRDDFGLHKIIVVATSVGKLFGIDTQQGATVWSYRLPYVAPFEVLNKPTMLLFVQRTARYSPLPALCTLVAQDALTGNSVLFQFDPITGLSRQGVVKLGYKVKQAMLLPYEDENHLKPLLIVDQLNNAYVYPNVAKKDVYKQAPKVYFYTVDPQQNIINGYSLAYSTPDNILVTPSWEVKLGQSRLVSLSSKPSNERVHSQGRVLPDRSVYYKYVNPNLIALATVTDDPLYKHVLSIYLIDGITGLILYSTSHKKAKEPVHLVHSENWIAYSYFNERFRRTEIAAAELYEGHLQSNSSVFSSHATSQLPQIQTQAYILPSHALTMAVTLTERGITSKCLLVGLNSGSVAEIPWGILQPRFPDLACGPEEMCFPYLPEVPLPAEATLNYNQTLSKIRGISVAPAKLESTSHVLVYGLDLFYTRLAPSKTFDVLKEDFDHNLIVLVLVGLFVGTLFTKHLAAKKTLKQAWK